MSSRESTATPEILSEYHQVDNHRRLVRLRIALLFSILFFPPGYFIDLLVYPESSPHLLKIRLAVAIGFSALLLLTRLRLHRTTLIWFGIIIAILDIAVFCGMTLVTNGAYSPYYAGINLILLSISILMPWTIWETATVSAVGLLLYVGACLSASGMEILAQPVFLNNSFFVFITGAICVISSGIQSRARFSDFQLRHQLDVQNRELQALDRLKTNFFSNVTHELRTPLTLILGPVETILKKSHDLPPQIHENLLLAQRNALRLLKLINDLLDLTRMEQGENVLSLRRFRLEPYLGGIVDSVRHLGLAKGISIRLLEGNSEDTLEADPAKLEKIVLNLLTNAVKFTPRGGTISVSWERQGDRELISVTDTGVGISLADQEKIFDRFYQVSGDSGRQSQGVGIGLALVKELVEQHGGTLRVASESGRGSTFTADLPVAAAHDETVPLLEPSGSNEEDSEPFREAFRSADRTFINREVENSDDVRVLGSGQFTVLVVEDEPDVLRYISGFLSEKHRVVLVREGSQTEALVEEFQPDLLLLDWMLPDRSGLSICHDLRQDPKHSDRKIVILTARVDEESKMEALKAGADDFLLKPFSSLELQTRIDNLLRSGELQKRLRERNTELQETLRKLEQTEAQLIQSEKMNALGSLSAGLLHEINNPLNYAFSGIQLLEMNPEGLDEDSKETVADIRDGIKRVIDVIRDLKTFAYPEKPGSQSRFPIREIVDPARKIATRELEDIEFVEEFSDDLTLDGQKTQWLHVLINLFTNAGRALHEGPDNPHPRIILRAEKTDKGLLLSCTDNGPGIPKEIIKRIFDPFFTTRDVGEGMGMGLSICRTIVENHGGSMEVKAIPNQETTFTIFIPESQTKEDHE